MNSQIESLDVGRAGGRGRGTDAFSEPSMDTWGHRERRKQVEEALRAKAERRFMLFWGLALQGVVRGEG